MSITISLVTAQYAKTHIKPASSMSDPDVNMKIYEATLAIMHHCKLTDIPADWFSDTPPTDPTVPTEFIPQTIDVNVSPPIVRYVNVPGNISTAIMLYASELFYNREASNADPLSPAVLNVLEGFRTPTLA